MACGCKKNKPVVETPQTINVTMTEQGGKQLTPNQESLVNQIVDKLNKIG